MLDAACRRVAGSSSVVIVSLREAVDDTLKSYFRLLDFVPMEQAGNLYNPDFLARRNGPDSPLIEEICPHFPMTMTTTTTTRRGTQSTLPIR